MAEFARDRAGVRLGVNIDHVATLRQARRTTYPDPVEAALAAERGGAQGITVHLREDRRHIQDHDVERIHRGIATRLNLEMAATEEMTAFVLRLRPPAVCIVPENREELTTEGGLAVAGHEMALGPICKRLAEAGVEVSLFIDPEPSELDAAASLGVPVVELHTGAYAGAAGSEAKAEELERIRTAAVHGSGVGLQINGGHGLTIDNVGPIAALPGMVELNIGHSIVSRAVFVGMEAAVREMLIACRTETS